MPGKIFTTDGVCEDCAAAQYYADLPTTADWAQQTGIMCTSTADIGNHGDQGNGDGCKEYALPHTIVLLSCFTRQEPMFVDWCGGIWHFFTH